MGLKLCAAYGRNITSLAPQPASQVISSRQAHQCRDEEQEQESRPTESLVGEEI